MSRPHSMTSIPLELVREIAEAAYLSEAPHEIPRLHELRDIGVSTKPSWTVLSPLSRASPSYHEIVLEVWFRTLQIQHPGHLAEGVRLFPKISQWTRFLHCDLNFDYPPGFPLKAFDLAVLPELEVLRVDHSIQSPYRYLKGVKSPFWLFENVPPTVVEVNFNAGRAVTFPPHPSLFKGIESFVNLKILRLRMTLAWCDLCFLDQYVLLASSPVPECLVYEGGKGGLSIHFRKTLSCLQRLETVSFTTDYAQYPTAPDLGVPASPVRGIKLVDDEQRPTLAWSGECEGCVRSVLPDESFRSRWVALKTGQIEEMVGSLGRKYRFYPIPSLKRVEWYFVQYEGNGEGVEEEPADYTFPSEDELEHDTILAL